MTTEDFKRKLTAILSADVVGYSRLMGEDEDSTVRTLKAYRNLMSSLIERFNGRVVDSPGDNLLAEFESVRDAVQCAVEIQEELTIKNIELPSNKQMKFRIGINLGDVIHDEDRIYGDGINVASRVESLADGGGISISGAVYDAIRNKLSLQCEFQGEHSVKNIKDPVRVYRVHIDSKTTDKVGEEKKIGSKSIIRNIAVVVFIILVGLLIWKFYPIQPDEQVPKSIAVLPFDDLSPEKDQDHFVLGLSEEILNSLAKIPDLTVIAKTSSFSFRGKDKTIQEIAKELGVDHILEGSVRKYGDAIRITAQLIKAEDESHLWSETYDKDLNVKEIYAVQEDIANSVADKLKLTLDAFQLGGTENLEAYEKYLETKGVMASSDYDKALELIEDAIALDPGFALAWAYKGSVHLFHMGGTRSTVDRDSAEQSAIKTIELDSSLGQAYLTLGTVYTGRGEFIKARKTYMKGMELNTDLSDYYEYGLTLHYFATGYLEKTKEIYGKVLEKDPLQLILRIYYMLILGSTGDMLSAEEEYKLIKTKFGDLENIRLADAFISLLRLSTKKELSENDIPEGDSTNFIRELMSSSKEERLEIFQSLSEEQNSGYVGGAVGDTIKTCFLAHFIGPESAIEIMEKSNSLLGPHTWVPLMKEVRQLPRFKEFVRKIGLVDYWKEYGWPDLCRPIGNDDFECN